MPHAEERQPQRGWLPATLMLAALSGLVVGEEPEAIPPVWRAVDRIGPPKLYSPPGDRYRVGATDVANPAFYPIPRGPVTRDTYLDFLAELGLFGVVDTPAQGLAGPQRFMPVLVK